MKKLLLIALFTLMSTSCYRMPAEGEVSVVPTTNNPTLTRQEQTPWVPAAPQD
jgi:PBP1b-binding outer membrane lipoprotein LpoB